MKSELRYIRDKLLLIKQLTDKDTIKAEVDYTVNYINDLIVDKELEKKGK